MNFFYFIECFLCHFNIDSSKQQMVFGNHSSISVTASKFIFFSYNFDDSLIENILQPDIFRQTQTYYLVRRSTQTGIDNSAWVNYYPNEFSNLQIYFFESAKKLVEISRAMIFPECFFLRSQTNFQPTIIENF